MCAFLRTPRVTKWEFTQAINGMLTVYADFP